MNPTGSSGSFDSYIVKNELGMPAAVTFTTAQTAQVVGAGHTFCFICSNGGTPDVEFLVNGNVTMN